MISFRPLRDEDAGLLLLWIASPHVSQWWLSPDQSTEDAVEEALNYIGAANATAFIIEHNGQPMGYFQCYECHPDHDPEDPCFSETPKGTFLIDMFIGDASHLGEGLGAQILRKGAEGLLYKGALCLRVAPHTHNIAGIKTCERAGFTPYKTNLSDFVLMSRTPEMNA